MAYRQFSQKKASGKVNDLKKKVLIAWHKVGKRIECSECKSLPTDWNSVVLKTLTQGEKLRRTIPSPANFHMHIKHYDKPRIDLIEDIIFRCGDCYKNFADMKERTDSEHIIHFKTQQKLGGDAFDLGRPRSMGAYGMGKRR